MTEEFRKLVDKLAADPSLDVVAKKGYLESLKLNLIERNGNRFLDRERAENHFECLRILDDAISCLVV